MDAIIFAAGKGTRLLPHTETTPKPLLEVKDGKKIIDYIIEALPDEITRVIIVVEHLKEKIQLYISEAGIKKELVFVEQGKTKGTYGALLSAKPQIKSDRFLVLNGDDVVDKQSLQQMIAAPRTLGVHTRIMPGYYAVLHNEKNIFTGFRNQTVEEVAYGAAIATGTYVLDHTIFSFEPVEINGGEYGLPQMFLRNLETYPLVVVPMGVWFPINSIEDLENLQNIYKGKSEH